MHHTKDMNHLFRRGTVFSAAFVFHTLFLDIIQKKILSKFEKVNKTMVHYKNRQHQLHNKAYFCLWPVTARGIIYIKHNL